MKKVITLVTALTILFGTMVAVPHNEKFANIITAEAAYSGNTLVPIVSSIKSTQNTITVSWKSTGADEYRLYLMSEHENSWNEAGTISGTQRSYVIRNLSPNTQYYICMRARSNKVWGAYSDCYYTATCTTATTISYCKSSSTTAKIAWRQANGAYGYEVQIKKDNKWSTALRLPYYNATSGDVTGLKAGKTYYARVSSYIYDGSGNKHYSSYSNSYKFTTKKNATLKSTVSKAKVNAALVSTAGSFDKTQAKDCARMINSLRKGKNLNTLTWDETLYKCAQNRAKEITKKYSHSRPNGKSCGTICKIYKGENIAKGQTSAYSVYEAWYKSAGHKANMERKGFKKFAVACYKMNGTYYWVTAFGY